MDLEILQKKKLRLMDIHDELEQIAILEKELNFMETDIDSNFPDHAFGLFWEKRRHDARFAFNGALNKYTDLTKNIILITRIELEKKKQSLKQKLRRNLEGLKNDKSKSNTKKKNGRASRNTITKQYLDRSECFPDGYAYGECSICIDHRATRLSRRKRLRQLYDCLRNG